MRIEIFRVLAYEPQRVAASLKILRRMSCSDEDVLHRPDAGEVQAPPDGGQSSEGRQGPPGS
jgi:hypothetical protein